MKNEENACTVDLLINNTLKSGKITSDINIQDLSRIITGYFAFIKITEPEFFNERTNHLRNFALEISKKALIDFGRDGDDIEAQKYFDNWVNRGVQLIESHCEEHKHLVSQVEH